MTILIINWFGKKLPILITNIKKYILNESVKKMYNNDELLTDFENDTYEKKLMNKLDYSNQSFNNQEFKELINNI